MILENKTLKPNIDLKKFIKKSGNKGNRLTQLINRY